ncbi:MAG: ISNCY family transposase [Dehalococcoidia bacterium]|nr:ISNCY family transposase [Dehalococcoidia bacterium]MDP7360252.1 ISNCY family transposase [Pseudomonadales bacterium]MDP7532558.1 ISNCY family transposase [SAR202 cluster bacterium]
MTAKEQKRIQVLAGVLEGGIKLAQASELMGVSERHAWRLLAAFKREGAAAIAHGNRGRTPQITTDPAIQDRVKNLAKGTYEGLNHTHLTEVLAEREGIDLSRSTVRRILLSVGIKSHRKRRAPKHHSRRKRYPQEGMLLQIDGSKHDWLEGRGPYLTLIAAIDDATSTVPFALFRDQEDAHGYLLMLRHIIQDKGIPLALYSDRHGIFQRSPKEPESLREQLRGKRDATQFGRALQELGIELIVAYTPQAKGRVERLFGTLQDRLVSEMRLAGATTVDDANRVLWRLLPSFNQRFGVCAEQPGSAYREPSADLSIDSVLCFKYLRNVANDNTVHFHKTTLQLLPDAYRASYAKATVEVQERLDGSLVVVHAGKTIGSQPAPLAPVTLRARNGRRATGAITTEVSGDTPSDSVGYPTESPKQSSGPPAAPRTKRSKKPSPDHPWRRKLLT